MKIQSLITILLSVFCLTISSCKSKDTNTEKEDTQTPTGVQPDKSRSLVVYFSNTNHTKGIAEQIAGITASDTYRIEPETPYTTADLDYKNDASRANLEQNDSSARPAISNQIDNIDEYNTIFLGYPIWWGKAPKIIYTFLETYNLSGKTIIPFCTSGSSELGSSDTDLHTSAPGAQWKPGRRFPANASKEEIQKWIEEHN